MHCDRLYLSDSYAREFDAAVIGTAPSACVLSRTAFHPGGGGQPPDTGSIRWNAETMPVSGVQEDEQGALWHEIGRELPIGASVRGALDWPRRHAIMRHHCLLHVVNAIAWQRFGGRVSGAQIGPDRSRVDLSVPGFAREQVAVIESEVNEVLRRGLRVTASDVPEGELDSRPELVRTFKVRPPVIDGRVRIVEIEGFDAQACGGTHVHSTRDIGEARVARFENQGKNNKRFYWELAP